MSRNGSTWKPDGSGWRARIGVLTHDDSAISESELWTMAPNGVSLHTSRVFFADLATFADPPGPDNATELLARLPLQAIIYAWTVGSYLLGTTGEEQLVSRVERHSNGIPVLMSAPAATAGFRTLEAERIALVHAPFFTDDFVVFPERSRPLIFCCVFEGRRSRSAWLDVGGMAVSCRSGTGARRLRGGAGVPAASGPEAACSSRRGRGRPRSARR
jgi:hypothetical protein